MRKIFFLLCFLMAPPAFAENYGNGIIPVGPTKQVTATGTSASTSLTAVADYIVVQNEGTVFAYVVCTNASSPVAAVPGGTTPTSTPVSPSGGIILNSIGFTANNCAAVTAGTSATVDFTPVNLF